MKKVLTFVGFAILVVAVIALSIWLRSPRIGHVKDEAVVAGDQASYFKAAEEDYFHDMDQTKDGIVPLSTMEVQGRNTWIVWTGGNDRFWDLMSVKSFGALDFLKTVSSYPGLAARRENRWDYLGLVNEPCFTQATGPDPKRYGLWLDQRTPDCPADPFENESKYPGVKLGARGKNIPLGSSYGYATGVVGLRIFPNPEFDEAAEKHWDPYRYYNDPRYYEDKNLIKPYRVAMSCGFCHVGPNPLKPPLLPNHPKWENLSSNVGAQYFWIDRIFYWSSDQMNFIFQLFHTSRPGTLDTSLISTDNINNPRTMNAVYLLKPRLDESKRWGKETLAGGGVNNKQFNDYFPASSPLSVFFVAPSTAWTPRVLKDGSDSVGAMGALNRVYLNIGTFSEEWLLHFNALVGGKPISPIEVAVARKNSAYFAATEAQTPATAAFFLKTTEPHHLSDVENRAGDPYLQATTETLNRGKIVFAENCARCHSSKLPEQAVGLDPNGCAGKDYLTCFNKYWEWTKTPEFKEKMRAIVMADDFLKDNYLSAEFRVPVTLLHTNACSPLATNALGGNVWDNFSSRSYKDLPSVGEITWYHPVTGEPHQYTMPAGGRGYTRPPSLVSLWSTAPYLLNNSVGKFVVDPSVAGRMDSFDKSIRQMLWPAEREHDSVLSTKVPGTIDRTTTRSYIKLSSGFFPEVLRPMLGFGQDLAPWIFGDGAITIGPIPKGTPVSLLANLDPLPESNRVEHTEQLLRLVTGLNSDLQHISKYATDADAAVVLGRRVDEILSLSKCRDLVVNRGHYFGTDYLEPAEEKDPKMRERAISERGPGLWDQDKLALIEFLKTF